ALAAADRYLYLALPGVGLAMAGLAGAVPGRPRVWVSALLLLLLPALLLPISRARARVFTDSKRLWLANLEVWPDDVVAKVNLASWQMLRSRDGTAAARRLLREARSVATEPSHRLRIATMLFTCAHAEGDVSDALAQIETAVRVADELGGAPSLRAGGYRRTRVDLRLQWAETLEAAGRYEESEGVLDEILAVAPNQPDALGAKAQLLLSPLFARGTALPLGRGDAGLARARELLDRAIEAQGRRPSLPLGLARVDYHRLLGQRTEAMAVLNRLARHWRGHEKVHLKAASIYLDGAQIEGAIQELRTGLTYRESALLLEKLGQVQELSGRLASAEACFRRALALRPTSPRLRRQLARVLASSARRRVSLESPDKYASTVREALSLDPELPLLAYLEARLLGSRRDYDTALRRAREAADGLPDEPDVQQFRLSLLKQAGWWKLFQKKPEEAFRHFRELLDLAPRGFDVAAVIEAMRNEFNDRVAQASQAVVAEDWTAAESRFRAALELFPDHDGVVLQLGLVHYQLGRLVESIEGLRKAVRLAEKRGADPGRAVLYQVKVLREMKQREAARRLCELYLEGPKRDLLKDSVIRMRLQTQASALRDGG
ncbi:MAG: tetratricopeptide repeat protein, partial [Planctomycetota bacterium]